METSSGNLVVRRGCTVFVKYCN